MGRTRGGSPVIGILGGMGPAATADFYRKIVAATPAERDQDHLRTLIWSDPSIPDRATAFLHGGESPIDGLQAGALLLESAGADFLAVPCNTAHLFLEPVRQVISIPILDMIEATVTELVEGVRHASTVAVLGTAATIESGLYAARLQKYGLRSLDLSVFEQRAVIAAIAAVKSGNVSSATRALQPIIDALIARGAHTVIAGCTELPIALGELHNGLSVIDPTAALARECVSRARQLRPQRIRTAHG